MTVIYSVFIAASLICMLYVASNFVFKGEEWSRLVTKNVNCLVQNELLGLNEECPLELNISDNVYWMQGTVVLLASIASFSLSCSNSRFNDYEMMRKRARTSTQSTIKRLKKMGSIASEGGEGVMTKKHSWFSTSWKNKSGSSSGNKKSTQEESVMASAISVNETINDIEQTQNQEEPTVTMEFNMNQLSPPQSMKQIPSLSTESVDLKTGVELIPATTITPAHSKD